MLKKDIPIQMNLFGISTIPIKLKKKRSILSEEEREKRKEKKEVHTAWKLLKSRKFDEHLTERHKFLLEKHYHIKL